MSNNNLTRSDQIIVCRALITERTSGGRKEKARKGGYAGGRAPLGYTATRGARRLSLHEDGAAAVRRTFELAAEGGSKRGIAARLNAEGRRTAEGKEFCHVQVARILSRRDVHAGAHRYGGVAPERGEQPAILQA